jgi:hypothetical protein
VEQHIEDARNDIMGHKSMGTAGVAVQFASQATKLCFLDDEKLVLSRPAALSPAPDAHTDAEDTYPDLLDEIVVEALQLTSFSPAVGNGDLHVVADSAGGNLKNAKFKSARMNSMTGIGCFSREASQSSSSSSGRACSSRYARRHTRMAVTSQTTPKGHEASESLNGC